MAYQDLSFSAGETLTATKMNQMAANDKALHDGTGIAAGAITADKIDFTTSEFAYKATQRVNYTSGTAWSDYYPSGWNLTFDTVPNGIYRIIMITPYFIDQTGNEELDLSIDPQSGLTSLINMGHTMTDMHGDARMCMCIAKATGNSATVRAITRTGGANHSVRIDGGCITVERVK